MAKIIRTASAAWAGGLKDGKGAISLESGAMKEYPYGFAARFEGQKGTNPEELLRGTRRLFHHGAIADPGRSQADGHANEHVGEGDARAGRGRLRHNRRASHAQRPGFPAPTRKPSRNWPAKPRPAARSPRC